LSLLEMFSSGLLELPSSMITVFDGIFTLPSR
jgi:hypothetical protein